MNSALKYLLCFCVLAQTPGGWALTGSQSVALAEALTLKESPQAFQMLRVSAGKLDSTLKKMAESKPAEVTAHAGQTLLFLLTVAGVDLVYQDIQKHGGLSAMHGADITTLAADAVRQIATAAVNIPNNGSLWMSMAGASVASKLLEAPVAALSAVIANPESNRILFKGLQSSILLTGATLGWDLGAQLATEASYLLEDPADYERSENLFGIGKGAIFALLFSADRRDQKDLRLTGKMFRNVLEVALFNSDLRSKWLNNTWRTRWATGQTVTFLGMVAASTLAGSIVLPGGGTVAGFMFGVAGAVAAWALPESFKNEITLGLQSLRQHMLRSSQRHTNEELQAGLADFTTDRQKYQNIQSILNRRRTYRSDYITICLERARNYIKLMVTDPSQSASMREGIRAAFNDAQVFLVSEHQTLNQLVIGAANSDNVRANLPSLMVAEIKRADFIADFLKNLGDELEDALEEQPANQFAFNTLSPSGQEIIKYIEVAYSRGFREGDLVKAAADLDHSLVSQ